MDFHKNTLHKAKERIFRKHKMCEAQQLNNVFVFISSSMRQPKRIDTKHPIEMQIVERNGFSSFTTFSLSAVLSHLKLYFRLFLFIFRLFYGWKCAVVLFAIVHTSTAVVGCGSGSQAQNNSPNNTQTCFNHKHELNDGTVS